MKYKAIIFDIDGTLILNNRHALPTSKVTKAIISAHRSIHVGVATSRPFFMVSSISKKLKLSGPSIIDAGSRIIDLTTEKILFEQMMVEADIKEVIKIAKILSVPLIIQEGGTEIEYDFKKKLDFKKISNIHTHGTNPSLADKFIKNINHLNFTATHKVISWKKGHINVSISHSLATKQYAILEIAKILNIKTHEIIGVGDGYNDFPLLMACGLKVAMGNAVPELKAIADYIAPPVEKDGVADIIEKFVLNPDVILKEQSD